MWWSRKNQSSKETRHNRREGKELLVQKKIFFSVIGFGWLQDKRGQAVTVIKGRAEAPEHTPTSNSFI